MVHPQFPELVSALWLKIRYRMIGNWYLSYVRPIENRPKFQGISQQNMAKHRVRTYKPIKMDPEIPTDGLSIANLEFQKNWASVKSTVAKNL